MIARILESNTSSRPALDYSEKKLAEGNARLVAVRNLPDARQSTIYNVFDAYEENPAISERTRRKSFHLTVSPDVTDPQYSVDQTNVNLIDDLMEGLGYKDQPYVIYGHADIERNHYHVVCPRFNEKGRVIDDTHEGEHLLKLLKELRPKYGYTVGREEEKVSLVEDVRKVRPEDTDKLERVKVCFEEALKYNYGSFLQFSAVLANMGVYVKKKKKEGKEQLWFSVMRDDESLGMVVFGERLLRTRALERYRAREKSFGERKDDKQLKNDAKVTARMRAALLYCSAKASTWQELVTMMRDCGLDFNPKEKAGRLSSYTLIDSENRWIALPSNLGAACSVDSLNANGISAGDEVAGPLLGNEDFERIRQLMLELLRAEGYKVTDGRRLRKENGEEDGQSLSASTRK